MNNNLFYSSGTGISYLNRFWLNGHFNYIVFSEGKGNILMAMIMNETLPFKTVTPLQKLTGCPSPPVSSWLYCSCWLCWETSPRWSRLDQRRGRLVTSISRCLSVVLTSSWPCPGPWCPPQSRSCSSQATWCLATSWPRISFTGFSTRRRLSARALTMSSRRRCLRWWWAGWGCHYPPPCPSWPSPAWLS